MSRLQIDVSIGIMRELYFSPRRSSALHVAFRSNINLTKRGFAAEGGLTAEGRQILGLATDLFELAERLHTSRKAAE